jgi:hypothetical protein
MPEKQSENGLTWIAAKGKHDESHDEERSGSAYVANPMQDTDRQSGAGDGETAVIKQSEGERAFFYSDQPEANFTLDIFIEQFMLHIFGWLYIPFLRSKHWNQAHKHQALVNQGMWPPNLGNVFFNIGPAIAWPTMIVLFLVYRTELEEQGYDSSQLVLGLIPMVAHRLMVSLKYALLTPAEYERYLTETDPAQSARFASQVQISFTLSSSADQHEIIEAEIELALLRCLMSVEDSSFEVICRHDDWKKLLGTKGGEMQTDGFTPEELCRYTTLGYEVRSVAKIYLSDVLTSVIFKARKLSSMKTGVASHFMWSALMWVVVALNGRLYRVYVNAATGSELSVASFVSPAIAGIQMYLAFFMVPLTTFFFAFISHHRTMFNVYNLMGQLIEPNREKCDRNTPRLDFLNPANVRCWIHCIMVLVNYKARLMQRIEIFVAILLVLLASVFVVVILPSAGTVFSGKIAAGYYMNQATWHGFMYFYIFFPLLLWGVIFGALSNSYRRKYQLFAVEHRIAAKGGTRTNLSMPAIQRQYSLQESTLQGSVSGANTIHTNTGLSKRKSQLVAANGIKDAGARSKNGAEGEEKEEDDRAAEEERAEEEELRKRIRYMSKQLDELLDSMTIFTEKLDLINPVALFDVPLDSMLVSSMLTIAGSAVFLSYRLFEQNS